MREPVRDRERLEHIKDAIERIQEVKRYLADTDWTEWENNEQAKAETAVHKSLMQTAWRMKNKGYEVKEIMSITGLTAEEIEAL